MPALSTPTHQGSKTGHCCCSCCSLQAYFYQFWRVKTPAATENSILLDLPSHLRDQALTRITGPLVAQVHGLQLLQPQLQTLIAGSLRSVTFPPGASGPGLGLGGPGDLRHARCTPWLWVGGWMEG